MPVSFGQLINASWSKNKSRVRLGHLSKAPADAVRATIHWITRIATVIVAIQTLRARNASKTTAWYLLVGDADPGDVARKATALRLPWVVLARPPLFAGSRFNRMATTDRILVLEDACAFLVFLVFLAFGCGGNGWANDGEGDEKKTFEVHCVVL
jgi:hypothetical protein